MISFNSVAHFFAKAFQTIKNDLPKVATGLEKVEAEKPLVEGVTAAAGGSVIVPLEDAAFACLGAVSAFLSAGGSAAAQKLQDLGLDQVAIQKAQSVLGANQALVTVAKAL